MRYARAIVVGLILATSGAKGQQPQSPPLPAAQEPLEIYQIDLVPSGAGFALTKPVLEGDVYVFKVWPDRATVRLPQSRVKKMVRRTKDINDEVLYQIDLVPSGQMYARENPTRKGTTYVFHTFRDGTLMSLRQADVQKVTRLTGLDAFKVHMQQLGATQIDNLPMGSGSVTVNVPAAPPDAPQGQSAAGAGQPPGNWIYYGVPGVTDAWAPPAAVISAPGDVPKAPEPH
jgi:hypothetical protein